MLFLILCSILSLTVSTSIYDDSIPLPVLDERIIKAMANPQKDKGDDLLADAYNYFNILDDIEILIKDGNSQGIERLEKLIQDGGPKFVNATMAEDDMWYYFKWEPSEFNELRASIDGTKVLYKRLLKRLEKRKTKKRDLENSTSIEQTSSELMKFAEEEKDMSICELDNLIVEELVHPQEGGGRKLLKHAFKYFDILDEVKDLMEEKDPNGFAILRNITYDGPKWIRTKYDESLLKEVYKFKKDDLKHLNASIESTKRMWRSFVFHSFNFTGMD